MGGSQSVSVGDRRIKDQEMYVSRNFQNAKKQLNRHGYSEYTDTQIRGKLRQTYHGNTGGNDYIMKHRWEKIKGNLR